MFSLRLTKCRTGSTVDLPLAKPKICFALGSLNISLVRISLSMIFSIVGRRDIGMWPLPPGLGIVMIIEVFQSLGVLPSLHDRRNIWSKDVCKFVFCRARDILS